MQLQGPSRLQQQRTCIQHVHCIVIPTGIEPQFTYKQQTIDALYLARSTLANVARAYQQQQPGGRPASQSYQAPLSKQLEEYRDWITAATTPPNAPDVGQLALYANRLRQIMITIPDKVRNSPAVTRAAQHARLQADCTYCLLRMLSGILSGYKNLNLQQLCMVMSTIRTAQKLNWILSPTDWLPNTSDTNAPASYTKHTPSQSNSDETGLDISFAVGLGYSEQRINEAQQKCSQLVYTTLPLLCDHAVSLISSVSQPLRVKDFAFVATQLLNSDCPLLPIQKAAVATALEATLTGHTDDCCTDAAAQLVCMVARLCDAPAVVPTLHILLQAWQYPGSDVRLSLASYAHLVWLTAQLMSAVETQFARKGAAATQTDVAAHVECPAAGLGWVEAWSACAGTTSQSFAVAASAISPFPDQLLQSAERLSDSSPWTIPTASSGQVSWVAEWSQVHNKWLASLEVMMQKLIVDNEIQQASKLSHAGLLVSHWQAAGLPCTIEHASMLAGIVMPALASQPVNASAALPLAQLAGIIPIMNSEGVVLPHQGQISNSKDARGTHGPQHLTQELEHVLESWLHSYCTKVAEAMQYLSDAQLQYIVCHVAEAQLRYPQLKLLPPLTVPVHWLAIQHDKQGSNIASCNQWDQCMQSWFEHHQQAHGSVVDATDSSRTDVTAPSLHNARKAAGTQVLPVLASMHTPLSMPATMLLAASIADYLHSTSPATHCSSPAQPEEYDEDDAGVDTETMEGTPFETMPLGSTTCSKQAAPTSDMTAQYAAWPLLIGLMMRSVTAAAVGLAETSTHLPALKAPQYAHARATAGAAQAFEDHPANHAVKSLAMYSQLSAKLNFRFEHRSRHAALKLLSLMQAMQCIPGVKHLVRSNGAAAAITVAMGRAAPTMRLTELFSCLNTAHSLGITPQSSTFRGTVQAQVARLIKAGALRHEPSADSSPRVLVSVIKLLRVLKDFRMTLGPRAEDALTEELLSYHLQGQLTIPVECQKCSFEQGLAAVNSRSHTDDTHTQDQENTHTRSETGPSAVTSLDSNRQLGFHTCNAVQLSAGYILDKELVQLLKLMAVVPFMADQQLTDKLQSLIQTTAEAGRLRAKYVAACITSLKKLGFLAQPAVLAALLKAGLLTTPSAAAEYRANSKKSVKAANHDHTSMATASVTPELREVQQQQSLTINTADYRAVMMALDNVKYPAGSSAQAYLRDIVVTMHKITKSQAPGSKTSTRVLKKVAGQIELHISRLAGASTAPGTARGPPSGRAAGNRSQHAVGMRHRVGQGDDDTDGGADPLDSFIASQLAALRAKQDSSNE